MKRIAAVAAGLAHRLRQPRTTVRWRLTLLYGGLFLLSGAGLLAITYTLLDGAQRRSPVAVSIPSWKIPVAQLNALRAEVAIANGTIKGAGRPAGQLGVRSAARPDGSGGGVGGAGTVLPIGHPGKGGPFIYAQQPPPGGVTLKQVLDSRPTQIAIAIGGATQRDLDLHHLLIESSIALAIMAILAALLGWLVAGRVLRPLRVITTTTQEISEANLDRRLAMTGPPDELRRLSDTIDSLLERLEGAFEAQRRFVANASHELRTPLTTTRALLEMAISDPAATPESYREICEQVLDEGDYQEQLIDALLTLAQSQRGLDHHQSVDLAEIASRVIESRRPAAEELDRTLEVSLVSPAPLSGDARLLERLVANLLDNAIRYNVTGGRVEVEVPASDGQLSLTVRNTGPVVPGDEVDRLLQPFQRLEQRVRHHEGLGLGLSIVAAIADAHGATLTVAPRADGGLAISVRFPAGSYAATSWSRLAATPSISSLNDSENFSTPSRSSRSTTSS
jgi:signal transduction histidine kinase